MPEVSLCRNCHYPLAPKAEFCTRCGQKNTDGKVRLGTLINDFFADILNLDNKLWKTFHGLLFPGYLTKAYFEGKQKRFASPIRLFFLSALLLFFVIGYYGNQVMTDSMSSNASNTEKEIYQSTFLSNLKIESDSLIQELANYPSSKFILDSLYQRLHKDINDSISIGIIVTDGSGENLKVASTDLADLTIEELLDRYEITSYWQRLHYRQYIRLTQQGDNFSSFILGKMIWMLLLLMPALACILKLLYIRHQHYFVEHLVFSFHTHAFVFLAIAGIIALANIWPESDSMIFLCWVIGITGAFYPMFAMRRFYGQSGIKTFFKYCLVSFCYAILFSVFLMATFALTAITY